MTGLSIDRLLGERHNPHAILGLHHEEGQSVVRLYRPGAVELFFELCGDIVPMNLIHESGLFEFQVPQSTTPLDYLVYHASGLLAHDPYSFWPTIGEIDQYLFAKGVHYRIYDMLGAHRVEHQSVMGVKFAVWAPEAVGVSLVADFNHWDGRTTPMRSLGASGIWEIFVPGLDVGEKYKFEIRTKHGEVRIKADPYAFAAELRPETASIVANVDGFEWSDASWMAKRPESIKSAPMLVYELHLGSWKRGHTYRSIAEELVTYCKEMGFTHVELMPIAEHPLDESWGYQVSGFYAVTSRYGLPSDFQFLVNTLHEAGIGVILDWVPGHFPTDDFSLARFDGSCLYEHMDHRLGFHPHWQTHIFNYGRHEVSNFLIGNALFWFDKMHIDGIRVDAVASMLYRDYGREDRDWIPNQYGGKENLEAIEFLKHLNSVVHERFPRALMIAEESTAFTGITHHLSGNGLGFDLKWNMGWMNDTLSYFRYDPYFRTYHQNMLTFGLIYAFSEQFILVLSHDEVVHGKGSLMSKMPGDYWQKFANMRLLYSYMICQPGKKLLFMGGEIGQWNEWNCKAEIEWSLLQFPIHSGLQRMIKELNHFYLSKPALWQQDTSYLGFEWVDFADHKNSVIIYRRKGLAGELLVIHNFTPTYHDHYFVKAANLKSIHEVFNTDEEAYGGSGKVSSFIELHPEGFHTALAPLATQIYEIFYG